MPNQTLTCCDCANPFDFSEGEAAFFEGRGLKPPKRCKDCRAKKKVERATRVMHDNPQS